MKNINDTLSEILEIEPIDLEEIIPNEIVITDSDIELSSDIEVDFAFARENLKNLIKKGTSAIDSILFVARESEHPRAFEVASNFLKNLSDMNKDLLELQKAKKDVQRQNSRNINDPGITVQKAVFIGSTNELNKLIKAKRDE